MVDARRGAQETLLASLEDGGVHVHAPVGSTQRDTLLGWSDALRSKVERVEARLDDVVCIAEPLFGWDSGVYLAPPVAATLAACNLPTYITSSALLSGPRRLNHIHGLSASGLTLPDSLEIALSRLDTGGVTIVTPAALNASLDGLVGRLDPAVDHALLGWLAALLTPIRGARRTHLVTGTVQASTAATLVTAAQSLSIDSLLYIAGQDGHIDPRLDGDTETAGFGSIGIEPGVVLRPKSYGLLVSEQSAPPVITVEGLAEAWTSALHKRKRFPTGLAVRLIAGTILAHVGRASTIMRGVGMAHGVIRSGAALQRMSQFGLES